MITSNKKGFTRQSFLKKNLSGFTLIELLIVIAIIGILSSVVLVNLSSTKNRAYRASALATSSSIAPELVTCRDDNGFGASVAPTAGVTPICCNVSGCVGNVPEPGHTILWPSLGSTTGVYAAPAGTLANDNYVFTVTSANWSTITCTVSTASCN